MKEVWKLIDGYPLHSVSNLGRVRSVINGRERILKPSYDKDGYALVVLSRCGIRRCFRVHRLVAIAHIPNPDNLPLVNHQDECKWNNRADNLEWCTHRYNTLYRDCAKRRAVSFRRPVLQLTLDGDVVMEWESITAVRETLGYNTGNIVSVCQGKRSKAHGYLWEYAA